MKISKRLRIILICVFSCVFLVCATVLSIYYIEAWKEAKMYEELSQLIGQVPTLPSEDDLSDFPTAGDSIQIGTHYVTVTNSKTGETISVLPQYATLFSLNPDFVGWIKIPGTEIDYPVMQSTENPNYYLTRNFYEAETDRGSIYADSRVDIFTPSDNFLLHGHHMKDGSMFGSLVDYKNQSYYEEHKYIFFDTLQQTHTYEIMAVFVSSVAPGEDFAYYNFIEANDEADFASFVRLCKRKSLYDTGVDAVYGDKLLTLSTCEYSEDNSRFVVVAKQVE